MSDPPPPRSHTALTTVKVVLGLVVLKWLTWIYTGSSGMLGSALDSLFDVLASLLVLWAVTTAERPADADHPWGHGKAEGLASLFQAIVVLIAGLGFVAHTVDRFLHQEEARLEGEWIGVGVMILSSAVTVWLVWNLRRSARATGSPALEADSQHYASDLLLNASVAIGLVSAWLLDGQMWPDLAVGLGIAVLILNTARRIFLHSLETLMDRGLRPGEAAAILRTVAGFAPRVAGFHDLRSRRSGTDIFIELHLDLDRGMSFIEAHDIGEQVRLAVERALQNSTVTVHADPI
jgi:ferrous-iron efflux pump FieF